MTSFPRLFVLGLGLGTLLFDTRAAVPPPEQLLPADTLAVLAAPDWSRVVAARKDAPVWLLWNDPALKPFKDKLVTKVTQELVEPLERELGIKLADYRELAQGQVTLAVTQNGWTGTDDPAPGLLLLVDARDKAPLLKTNLAGVRQKLTDAGRQLKTEKIRDLDFTTVSLRFEEISKALEESAGSAKTSDDDDREATPADAKPADDAQPAKPLEVTFGQSGSLLLAGTNPKDLEKVLIRLSGGTAPCVAEVPAFEANQRMVFRDALSFGWIHLAPVVQVLTKLAAAAQADQPGQPPAAMPMKPDKVLGALGLNALATLAFGARQASDGAYLDLFMGVPENQRKGLFRLLATEPADAGPAPFVPADAVQFTRWRLNAQQAWTTLEGMANEIQPGMLTFLLTQIEAGLKEKDPSFDLRKNLIGNLGNDFVGYQKAPRGNTLDELTSPPSLTLLGSPNPEQLLQTLKSLAIMLPAGLGADLKDREFLGRRIVTLPLPSLPTDPDAKPQENAVHFSASGGYLAISSDAALIEEYLRSADTRPKPLSETPGLSEASQKVGGTATGLFSFQNDAENMRGIYEGLRKDPNLLTRSLTLGPLAAQAEETNDLIKQWVDFSLLPPFEKIARYFFITVSAGRMSPEGYSLKLFTPLPPGLKQ